MRKKTLWLILPVSIVVGSCGETLPPGFPVPAPIELCTLMEKIVEDEEGKKQVLHWWSCINTDTEEASAKSLTEIHIGVSAKDWAKSEKYKDDVIAWGLAHCKMN